MFNYYYYHEFCLFFGRRARLFLITTTIASFVFSGDVLGYCSINHYCCEFCCSIGVRNYFQLLLLLRVLCFRVACTVIFNYYYYYELCFPGGVHGYF